MGFKSSFVEHWEGEIFDGNQMDLLDACMRRHEGYVTLFIFCG